MKNIVYTRGTYLIKNCSGTDILKTQKSWYYENQIFEQYPCENGPKWSPSKKIKRGYPFEPKFSTSSFSNLTLGKGSKCDFRKRGSENRPKFWRFPPRMTKNMSQKRSISEIFDEKIFMIKIFHFLNVSPNTSFKKCWKKSTKVSVKKYISRKTVQNKFWKFFWFFLIWRSRYPKILGTCLSDYKFSD